MYHISHSNVVTTPAVAHSSVLVFLSKPLKRHSSEMRDRNVTSSAPSPSSALPRELLELGCLEFVFPPFSQSSFSFISAVSSPALPNLPGEEVVTVRRDFYLQHLHSCLYAAHWLNRLIIRSRIGLYHGIIRQLHAMIYSNHDHDEVSRYELSQPYLSVKHDAKYGGAR